MVKIALFGRVILQLHLVEYLIIDHHKMVTILSLVSTSFENMSPQNSIRKEAQISYTFSFVMEIKARKNSRR